jgi:hypothetical protein
LIFLPVLGSIIPALTPFSAATAAPPVKPYLDKGLYQGLHQKNDPNQAAIKKSDMRIILDRFTGFPPFRTWGYVPKKGKVFFHQTPTLPYA